MTGFRQRQTACQGCQSITHIRLGFFFAKRYHGENGEIIKLILQPKQWLLDSFLYIVSKAVSFVNLLIGHLYYVCEARVPNKYTLLLQI